MRFANWRIAINYVGSYIKNGEYKAVGKVKAGISERARYSSRKSGWSAKHTDRVNKQRCLISKSICYKPEAADFFIHQNIYSGFKVAGSE